MVDFPSSDDLEKVAESMLGNLEQLNSRLEIANQFYETGEPFAGEAMTDLIYSIEGQYQSLASLVNNPLYEHGEEILEELERTEANMGKVSEYLSYEFEERDY